MLRRLSSSRRNSSASLQQQQHAAAGGDAEDSGGHFQRTAEDLRKELLEVQAQVEREQQELMMLRSARLIWTLIRSLRVGTRPVSLPA